MLENFAQKKINKNPNDEKASWSLKDFMKLNMPTATLFLLCISINWEAPDTYCFISGHGRRVQFRDNQEENSALESFLASKQLMLK